MKLFRKETKEDLADMLYRELIQSNYSLEEKSDVVNIIKNKLLQHASNTQSDADNAISKLV